MSSENVFQFPPRNDGMAYRRAEQLQRLFTERGKGQLATFQHLSIEVERLVSEIKAKHGERSGKMQEAFGNELVRMKGRFSARNGVPPKLIYRSPEAWLRVIAGLATALGQDPPSVVSATLGEALEADRIAAQGMQRNGWLDEFITLMAPMVDRLSTEIDLLSLEDYIARSGLYVENDEIWVSEWPQGEVGFDPREVYRPHTVGLVPHASGISYQPIADAPFDTAGDDLGRRLDEIAPSHGINRDDLERVTAAQIVEGTRIAAAITVRADDGRPDFAFLEWQVARIDLRDDGGAIVAAIPVDVDLDPPRSFNARPGDWSEATDETAYQRPAHWLPNSLRFHFPGTAGFERVASSLIVAPWCYSDPDEFWLWRPHLSDSYQSECPVASPVHTVAAAIEANLLYADVMGKPDERLDRKLLKEIHRVAAAVETFRSDTKAHRETARAALLAEWRRDDRKP